MSNRRKIRSASDGVLVEPGWRPREDGKGKVRVFGLASGNARRRFRRTWPMLRCRYCGAEPWTACVKRDDKGVLATETHTIRIDDTWELIHGKATLQEIDARGLVKTAAWPEARTA